MKPISYRTHHCGELRNTDVGQTVRLCGWVNTHRDHGDLIFVDIRDKYGLTQLVFDPSDSKEAHKTAELLKTESVIDIKGEVRACFEGMSNRHLPTGEIEIEVNAITVHSTAQTPPFQLKDADVNEELRLTYRYLELRKEKYASIMKIRHRVTMAMREYLDSLGFLDIQTPIMGRSTPEGARDYLVPSRVYPGHFYALPQSPQIFKQLLMVAGMDRYFQVATCFRDEDLRADRQPEFTQLDIEMSFSDTDHFYPMIENMLKMIMTSIKGDDVDMSFTTMTYQHAMDTYGCDKPDLRFDLPISDFTQTISESNFTIGHQLISTGAIAKGIVIPNSTDVMSRKRLDAYTQTMGTVGLSGILFMKKKDGQFSGTLSKFLNDEQKNALNLEDQTTVIVGIEQRETLLSAMARLRLMIGRDCGLIDDNAYRFTWVTHFPLFAYSKEEERLVAEHHPFVMPSDDIDTIKKAPLSATAQCYDIVLNGYELGSGSVRIHNSDMQEAIFDLMKLSAEDVKTKFGFFTQALRYGTPPHMGIALGVDRLVMILVHSDNIRDVIAFPKTQKAADLMSQAPNIVSDDQLSELELRVNKT
jgi:aspartyl-tRNA synthetase